MRPAKLLFPTCDLWPMTYDDLRKALQIFGLPDRASLGDIKSRHRELVKRHHPDSSGDCDDSGQIVRINEAYSVLLEYVGSYRFSFSESEFYDQNPDEQLRRQFGDPLWGGKS